MTAHRRWLSTLLLACTAFFTLPVLALEFSDLASEDEIKFLKVRPDPGAYFYESRVNITQASLETGSVDIATCHRQLDPIRKVVIVFNVNRIQAIQIKSFEKMGSAEVKDNEVILTDVIRGASICIDLKSKALDKVGNGQFKLNAGPLMRRYFDGYLPMAATLRIDWPNNMLTVERTVPSAKDGIEVIKRHDGVELDMIFAGKMTAQIYLRQLQLISQLQ
jgi:hypothetical protein